ncbi:MAG: hypothetical protein COA78_18130 [Blastopirellula sp.]|nr:MAG: hypothetical protein COA78_18130 [Blastopirellula sp.]
MDFLNTAAEQLKEMFREMTPGSRMIAGLLAAVIIASIGYLFQGGMFVQDTPLLSGVSIDSADQTAVLAAFANEGLDDYKIEGSQIMVPRSKRVEYIAAMAKHNAIPADFHQAVEDAVTNSNIFEPGDVRDNRNKVAREKDMALVLRNMRGIEHATVHYDIEDKGGFPKKKEYTASVAVRPSGSEEIDEAFVKSIRNYIAANIAGLDSKSVAVTDLNSGKTYSGSENSLGSVLDDPYAARKKWFEEDWQRKILRELSDIKGVSVTANVELNPTLNETITKTEIDPRPIPLSSSSTKRTESTKTPGPAGPPGLAAQGTNQPAQLSSTTTENTLEESTEDQTSDAGRTSTFSQTASLMPEQVKVTVAIPSAHYMAVWKSQNLQAGGQEQTPGPGELKKIEEETILKVQGAVVTLLPAQPPGDDPFPQVHVRTIASMPIEPYVEPTLSANGLVWLASNWQTMAMIGVGLFALMMLRSMTKSNVPVSKSDKPVSLELPPGMEDEDEEEMGMDGMLKKRFSQSGPNLKDELVDMVREDPDTAASILQGWIGAA